ncbi:ATP-binding protein [Sphaerisporangium aureirubrum]|uniref:ATP-binding protein n=1 Tax=Sphaerisporangium aureirubrum TaxID=1544736 RepID=A0ABW1NAT0_9ACTN
MDLVRLPEAVPVSDDALLRLDDAVLLLSEAATNSLVHTDSAIIGVTVVTEPNGDVRVEVSDQGAQTLPGIHPHPDDEPASSGRGIRLIRALSSRWGFAEQRSQSVLWFVLSTPEPGDPPHDPAGASLCSW